MSRVAIPPPIVVSIEPKQRSVRRIALAAENAVGDLLREIERAIDDAMPADEHAAIPARLGSAYALCQALETAQTHARAAAREGSS